MDFTKLLGGLGGGGGSGKVQSSATATSMIGGYPWLPEDKTPLYVVGGLAAIALVVLALLLSKGK